jgi:cytosine/adenosine deaminase-related metal-dependent hydrolase
MGTLLVKNAMLVATFDDRGTEIAGGGVYVEGNVIRKVGSAEEMPEGADRVIEARGMVVMPGMVNTHHHFVQTLTRCMPGVQDAVLFDWLKRLDPVWANLTPEAVYVSTKTAMAELMLSGCTTTSDHNYIWPNGSRVDDQVRAGREMGMRFHVARGSMSVGESKGGLPPDRVVEDEGEILRDSRRVIEEYHDGERYSMLRVVLAPCSPFTVSEDLMRESVEMARAYGVHSHTHLAETLDEADFCQEKFGKTPVELAEGLGWVGGDVWHAHMVHPSQEEVGRLGRTKTGVAHCPTSNMRLGSGIAPALKLLEAGARVGLGVDGSASNDGSHMLGEARQALLVHRIDGRRHGARNAKRETRGREMMVGAGDPGATTASGVLRMATRGGAEVLGRNDVGYLAEGMAADIVGFRVDGLGHAGGAVHDALAALVFCQPVGVEFSVINGEVKVSEGRLVGVEMERVVEEHNRVARGLEKG